MTETQQSNLTETILDFLQEIGITVIKGEVPEKTILPGITVDNGVIVVNENKMSYPGDLLHEAGHLAVLPAAKRMDTDYDVGNKAAEEMMAIAWSYAALLHLGLSPECVFHENGYRGGSNSLIENFTEGRYIGVPMLQYLGLTAEPKRAETLGIAPYPAMIKWILD